MERKSYISHEKKIEYIHFYNYERRQRKLEKLAPLSYRQLVESAA